MKIFLNFIFLIITFISISLVQAYSLTHLIDNGSQVVLRDLLFTKIYTEHELDELHKALEKINYSNYTNDDFHSIYKELPEDLKSDIEFSMNSFSNINDKVLSIINTFSPSFDREQCLINDLLNTTKKIYNSGEGCCSDYAKSAITILAIMGIKAREVNNNRHTSIEYFNPDTNSWIWIDPSYRLYAVNHNGAKLSAEAIFFSRYDNINYIEFGSDSLIGYSPFKENRFHKPNQNNALFYSLESLDPPLREKLITSGINPAITDLIFHLTNLRQGKLALMPYGFQSIIFTFSKYLAFLLIIIGLLFNTLISFFISVKITNNIFRTPGRKI